MSSKASIIRKAAFRLSKFAKKNAPIWLAAIGIAGVAGTAIFAVEGYKKTEEKLHTSPAKDEVDAVKRCAKYWAPCIVTGAVSMAAIAGGTVVSARRAAVLAGLLKASTEMADALDVWDILNSVEEDGPKVRQSIVDRFISDDDFDNADIPERYMVVDENGVIGIDEDSGVILMKDCRTGRAFYARECDILAAQARINDQAVKQCFATQNDFYDLIGLEEIEGGSDVGWTSYSGDRLLDVRFVLGEHKGKPCKIIMYDVYEI